MKSTHLIYIFHNKYNNIDIKYVYIGETININRRVTQHVNNKGAKNTKGFDQYVLVGLYDVINNDAFINYINAISNNKSNKFIDIILDDWISNYSKEYNFLFAENIITEHCIIINNNDSEDIIVKGGKYTNKKDYVIDTSINNIYIKYRPICHCNLPAEVFISKNKKIHFICPSTNIKKNYFYTNRKLSFNTGCNFFSLFDINKIIN
jgi:predicted GIY-YIG superfamily endonuclease